MVKEVEKLETEAQRGPFPTRNSCVLHDCEIGIDVMRAAKAIAALGERDRRTVTNAGSAEAPSIKPSFASSLHKKGIRAGRNPIRQCLSGQTRMRRKRIVRTLATGWATAERPDWHAIEEREVIL